jgi:ammonia channel protein AmtB
MKIDPFALLSGALGGMVAVTAVCDICETPLQAIGVGCVGGSCTWVTSRIVLLVLRLDDPVDAIAIHFGGGTAGVLLASGEAEATFAGQCLGLAAAIAYCGLMSYVMFALLDRCGWLRCTLGREDKGLSFVAVKERLPERHDPGERPELPEKLASQARRQRRFIKKSWVFCMAVVTLLIVRLLADIVLNLIKSASGE